MRPPLLELIETKHGFEIWKCSILVGTYKTREEAELMADMHREAMLDATRRD